MLILISEARAPCRESLVVSPGPGGDSGSRGAGRDGCPRRAVLSSPARRHLPRPISEPVVKGLPPLHPAAGCTHFSLLNIGVQIECSLDQTALRILRLAPQLTRGIRRQRPIARQPSGRGRRVPTQQAGHTGRAAEDGKQVLPALRTGDLIIGQGDHPLVYDSHFSSRHDTVR
jgi:hypothetical protein